VVKCWVVEENFAQIISPLLRLSADEIWGMQNFGSIFKFAVERRGVGKMCVFVGKLAISRKQ